MTKFQHLVNLLFTKKFRHKFIAYFLLVVFCYFFKDFLGFFLLTFIFAYLFYSLGEFLQKYLYKFIDKYCKSPSRKKIFKNIVSLNFIIILEYIAFIVFIAVMATSLVPKLINELSDLPNTLPFIADYANSANQKLMELKNINKQIGGGFEQIINTKDLDIAIDIVLKIKEYSYFFLEIVLSLILSFIFILDREKMFTYLQSIKKSSFNFLYKEYKIIFDKIVKSFGLIIKAQATIASVNTILTTLGLTIIALLAYGTVFPYIFTLAFIVFIAGFIPVLGTFLSSIPIIIVGYSSPILGGFPIVFEIIVLVALIHLIEAYYLNPKIVSKFLELPVSLTFIILILSEKIFGIAGLIIGISMFYFIVGLLRDLDKSIKKKKKCIKKIVKEVPKEVK